MSLRILYQDEFYVVVDKPQGFHVHPPESGALIPKSLNILSILGKQISTYLYPVHRLDVATSGVLIFGLSSEAAGEAQKIMQAGELEKVYLTVTRGQLPVSGFIDSPIDEKASLTRYYNLASGEVNTRRVSLALVLPKTGRHHQIRRHLKRISYPILGDRQHGDRKFDREVSSKFKDSGLYLKCLEMRLMHPITGSPLHFKSRFGSKWLDVFDFFGVCPYNALDVINEEHC